MDLENISVPTQAESHPILSGTPHDVYAERDIPQRRRSQLDQKLRELYERRTEDYQEALTRRTVPIKTSDGNIQYLPPSIEADQFTHDEHGLSPSFNTAQETPDLEDAFDVAWRAYAATSDFDYRISGALPEYITHLLDEFAELICDEAFTLTKDQRQAFLDTIHFEMQPDADIMCAINARCQMALDALLLLTGLDTSEPNDSDRRARLVRGVVSTTEYVELVNTEIESAEERTKAVIAEATETAKWLGEIDEHGNPRPVPLPSQLAKRHGNEPYTPEVHAEWTGWTPDDDSPTVSDDPYFELGRFGGDLLLAPIGATHPRQLPAADLDQHNPPRISDYVGSTRTPVEITDDGDGLLLGLQALGYALRWDLRSGGAQWTAHDPRAAKWHRLDDLVECRMFDELKKRCVMVRGEGDNVKRLQAKWAGQDRKDSIGSALQRFQVDSFEHDYLRWLGPWDGVPRIDTLIARLYKLDESVGADDVHAIAGWAARAILLGVVWRTLQPGYKLDEITVLIGPQGCGKSLFCKHLLPEFGRKEWFNDKLSFGATGDSKDQIEALRGRVIVESSEMSGLRRAEVEGLKAFLSRSADSYRIPYAKHVSNFARRCVIIGSSNRDDLLPNDPSGNRRFLPIFIAGRGPHAPNITLDGQTSTGYVMRDQLWAEALHRVIAGEEPRANEELSAAQARLVSEARRADDLIEGIVSDFLSANGSEPVELVNVHRHVSKALAGEDPAKDRIMANAVEARVTAAMRQLGWQSRRVYVGAGDRRRRLRRWVPKNSVSD